MNETPNYFVAILATIICIGASYNMFGEDRRIPTKLRPIKNMADSFLVYLCGGLHGYVLGAWILT